MHLVSGLHGAIFTAVLPATSSLPHIRMAPGLFYLQHGISKPIMPQFLSHVSTSIVGDDESVPSRFQPLVILLISVPVDAGCPVSKQTNPGCAMSWLINEGPIRSIS